MYSSFINILFAAASLSTATGVIMHDMSIDKAAVAALDASVYHTSSHEVAAKQMVVGPELHTHVERGSLSQTVHSIKTAHPRQQPRSHEDKKYVLQKAPRGYHPFDNYTLPL
jgi:hypothetical protein